MADLLHTTGSDASMRVTIDGRAVGRVLDQAPKVAYFWLRNYLGQILGKHRQVWLRAKGTRFGRGANAIRVLRVNERMGAPGPLEITYQVQPDAARAGSPGEARRMLDQLRGDIYTGNLVLPIHEFGTDIRSSRWMAIAVKTRPTTPAAWRRRNPKKTLISRPGRRGNVLLYEVQRTRGRGRPRKGEPPRTKERLRLRYVLTRSVQMDPTLRLYGTWDSLRGQRDQAWKRTADRMVRDLERGDPRDVA